MNKAIICGRLGRDPETRYSQGGGAVCNFSVATSEKWRDKASGQPQERTEWHNMVSFGRTAEVCGEYLRKGSQVLIEGRLQTDKYEKDGVTRYSTKIIVDRMQMLGSRQDSGAQAAPPQQQAFTASSTPEEDFEDDIPF